MIALLATSAQAGLISAGAGISTQPTALVDPLGSLAAGLSPDQFIVPIGITGALKLQGWTFDLGFDSNVATPTDAGGLFQQVYQADFSDGAITTIFSSGFNFGDLLQAVSGDAPIVSGDGPLAYVLFTFQPGQSGADPLIHVVDFTTTEAIPEPAPLGLVLLALLALGWRHCRPFRTAHTARLE